MSKYEWGIREDGVVMVAIAPGVPPAPMVLSAELVRGTPRTPGFQSVIDRWEPLARSVSFTFAIPPGWILAMIWRESGGNPRAFRLERDKDGAPRYVGGRPLTGVGLMQITNPALKGTLTDEQLFDPETNLNIGARYIAGLIATNGRSFPEIAAAFNHGHVERTTDNPWGMVQTSGHVSAEVSALDYYLLQQGAELAIAHQFNEIDLLGPEFGRVTLPDDQLPDTTPDRQS